jgi:cytoskeletal protein RodZ
MDNEPHFEGEKMKLPSEPVSSGIENKAEGETRGAFIIFLVIALVVILAGLFFWYYTSMQVPALTPEPSRPTLETNKEPETTTATAQVESYAAMSTSDELTAIEADLESTNLDSLDSELTQIDTELQAAIIE